MGNIRQLPRLYLRGSIATETMRNLNPEQSQEVTSLTNRIFDNPALHGHKIEFVNRLKNTIASDYRDDIQAAYQEYYITLWRGVVHLLYHCSYSFACEKCKSSTYPNKRKKPSPINRKFEFCPNCNHTKILDGGVEKFIHQKDLRSYDGDIISPIISVKGDNKVEDHTKVLNDPVQLKRFFTEFIWNYFRQIISENKIIKHAKEKSMIQGPADLVLFDAIKSLLQEHEVQFYCQSDSPVNGYYSLEFETLSTTLEFGVALTKLILKYACIKVVATVNINGVKIPDLGGSAPTAFEEVSKINRVTVVNNTDTECKLEPIELEADKFANNDDLEVSEVFQAVRRSLPNDYTVKVFDILYQRGTVATEFQKEYNAKTIHPSNITAFLKGTKKQTKESYEHIKVQLLRYEAVQCQ